MNKKLSRLAVFMAITFSVLAVFAAFNGIFNSHIYEDILKSGNITEFLVHGSRAQDIIMLPASITIIILGFSFLIKENFKTFIAILGLTGYVFYGYALYTIQGMYTDHYLIYIIIFSLSLYTLIIGLISFNTKNLAKPITLSNKNRWASIAYLSSVIIVLIPVWLTLLSKDMSNHATADTYGVFVLDLGIVFPAIVITIVMLLKKQQFGYILNGIMLKKALTVCISVAFGEWYVPNVGKINETNTFLLILFGILGTTAVLITFGYFKTLKLETSS